MQIALVSLSLVLAMPWAAAGAVRIDDGGTAGAASLLTAQRRAREAAERLRLPGQPPARWQEGGGWAPAWRPAPARRRAPAR